MRDSEILINQIIRFMFSFMSIVPRLYTRAGGLLETARHKDTCIERMRVELR